MALSGIEAALDRTVQQLSPDTRVQEDTKAAFRELFREMIEQVRAAAADAAPADAASAAPAATPTPAGPTTLYSLEKPSSPLTTKDVVSASAVSLLKDASLAPLEQLPNDLSAGDAQYNTREAMLRDRLNVTELERRLQSMAQAHGVTYDSSDLDGVLRNAGYGAAHLGSTERYMAAIDRQLHEADARYQQRGANTPGEGA